MVHTSSLTTDFSISGHCKMEDRPFNFVVRFEFKAELLILLLDICGHFKQPFCPAASWKCPGGHG